LNDRQYLIGNHGLRDVGGEAGSKRSVAIGLRES